MTAWPRGPDLARHGAALYRGTVMHARLQPFVHRFSYRTFSILIDIDRLPETNHLRLFSHNRLNLFSFHDRDHGPCDGSALRPYVDNLLGKAGIAPCNRVMLLCYPRVLGYVFNPLSVYYCYNDTDEIVALIYEVRNTFGGKHAYVAPVLPGQQSEAGIRQTSPKHLYVSPFFDMDMTYHFRVQRPGQSISLRIFQTHNNKPAFSAGLKGNHFAFTDRNLIKAFAAVPFLTLKVIFSIHWQALKLWLKGARIKDMPAHDNEETILDQDHHLASQARETFKGS